MEELGMTSHMLGIDEMHITFWVDSLKGIDHLGDYTYVRE
jgi:hypothetical protein